MKRSVLLITLFTLLISIPLLLSAQEKEVTLEKVVVTATRVETPIEEIASSITVIPSEEIVRKQKTSVLEVLRGLPGLDVVQTGGTGGTTSIFLRGANSEHTLVMIDGVEVNDPISPGRSYDFAHLTVDNIERIEVIRGPQSTLYGSDAIGGVINIITKKGEGKPKFSLSAEGG
ncbi:MAG: TonB-dependent receptor, partial [Deltaproteobacteria bacterium]|nr:TonB-dependent receptor [Deltaproteobacteria bacterium]